METKKLSESYTRDRRGKQRTNKNWQRERKTERRSNFMKECGRDREEEGKVTETGKAEKEQRFFKIIFKSPLLHHYQERKNQKNRS